MEDNPHSGRIERCGLQKVCVMNRSGESGSVPVRHSRIFQKYDYWYYRTREGIEIGPFDTMAEAQQGVTEFIDYVVNQNPNYLDILSRYKAVA